MHQETRFYWFVTNLQTYECMCGLLACKIVVLFYHLQQLSNDYFYKHFSIFIID